MLKRTVVFLSLLCVAFAAVVLVPQEEKPKKFADIEGCYISALDTVIPFGKSAPSKKSCMQYRCGKSFVEYASCGTIAASPPCYVVEDLTLTYPGCCKTIRCDDKH